MISRMIILFWVAASFCMQIIPWSINGIRNVFQKIPDSIEGIKPEASGESFIRKLFQNQISILFIVPIGIMYIDRVEEFGLIPSLPYYSYFLAFVIGIIILVSSIFFYRLVAIIMQRTIPKQLEHDIRQYQYNIGKVLGLKTWQKVLLAMCNGFSEELLMRVFVIGFLTFYLQVNPIISVSISLFLNALHHTYQGRIIGAISVVYVQAYYCAAYLIFRDFLLIAVLHVAADFTGLFIPGVLSYINNRRISSHKN